MVHRDLKPQNVMVAEGEAGAPPRVKLADFGISLLLEEARGGGGEGGPALAEQVDLAALQSVTGAANTEPGQVPRQGQVAATLDSSISSEFAANGRSRSEEGRRRTGPGTESAERGKSGRGRTGERDLTHTGVLIGTPIYMAPELRFGSKHAQPPVDVFSFGVLAFELLTGQAPFLQSPVVICGMGGELLIPTSLRGRAGLSERQVSLLEACLSVEPEGRPTAEELGRAFLVTATG